MRRTLLIVLVTWMLAGCRRPATVWLTDGRVVEGPISRGDAEQIFVGDEPVPRRKIRAISHPGKVHMVVGTVMAVIFGAGVIGSLAALDGDDADLARVTLGTSATLFLTGVGTAVLGWTVWSRSRAAARPPDVRVGLGVTSDGTATAPIIRIELSW